MKEKDSQPRNTLEEHICITELLTCLYPKRTLLKYANANILKLEHNFQVVKYAQFSYLMKSQGKS